MISNQIFKINLRVRTNIYKTCKHILEFTFGENIIESGGIYQNQFNWKITALS